MGRGRVKGYSDISHISDIRNGRRSGVRRGRPLALLRAGQALPLPLDLARGRHNGAGTNNAGTVPIYRDAPTDGGGANGAGTNGAGANGAGQTARARSRFIGMPLRTAGGQTKRGQMGRGQMGRGKRRGPLDLARGKQGKQGPSTVRQAHGKQAPFDGLRASRAGRATGPTFHFSSCEVRSFRRC